MKKNQIYSYVIMGCALIAALGVFLPYVSAFGNSISLWKSEDPARVPLILFCLIPIVVHLINKKTEFSYVTFGGLFLHSLYLCVANKGLDNFSIGFYLIILSSIAIGVLTFLYDEKDGRAIINLSINKQVANIYQQPQVQPTQMQQPVSFNQPNQFTNQYQQPVQPQQPNFDPQTGQPLNNNQNN